MVGRGGGRGIVYSQSPLGLFLFYYECVTHHHHFSPNCDLVIVEVTVFQHVVASEILK